MGESIFLTSVLAEGEWSASRPGRFTPAERAPGTHSIGGWVDPRAGLDDVEKRKLFTLTGLEFRPLGRSASSQSLYRLRLTGTGIDLRKCGALSRTKSQGTKLGYACSCGSLFTLKVMVLVLLLLFAVSLMKAQKKTMTLQKWLYCTVRVLLHRSPILRWLRVELHAAHCDTGSLACEPC
jgi:hypothetical protein